MNNAVAASLLENPSDHKHHKFSYWLPEEEEKMSLSFLQHAIDTAEVTDREVAAHNIEADAYGRVPWEDFERVLSVSNTDQAYAFDCAARHGLVHLQQLGTIASAAPDLDTGLTMFLGCISFFDDRLLSFKLQESCKTSYGFHYRVNPDPFFFNTQAGGLFLTAIDAWPTHYIDNSKMNFPNVPVKWTSTHGYFWAQRFPWTEIGCNSRPYLAWTVDTAKTKWAAPNFNPSWYNHVLEYVKSTLDALPADRQPWARFVTNIMMCNFKDLTLKKTCDLLKLTDVEVSKKLANESTCAAAIKDWILEETANRSVCIGYDEMAMAEQFGYDRGNYRARLRRRGIENPFDFNTAQVEELKRLYRL